MAGKVLPGSGIGQWAAKTLGEDDGGQDGKQGGKDDKDENPVGADAITLEDLLQRPDLPPEVREWLEEYAQRGPEWAVAHNPPSWVADKDSWEKAKRAAEHVTGDPTNYAFVVWWYLDHTGSAQK